MIRTIILVMAALVMAIIVIMLAPAAMMVGFVLGWMEHQKSKVEKW